MKFMNQLVGSIILIIVGAVLVGIVRAQIVRVKDRLNSKEKAK